MSRHIVSLNLKFSINWKIKIFQFIPKIERGTQNEVYVCL